MKSFCFLDRERAAFRRVSAITWLLIVLGSWNPSAFAGEEARTALIVGITDYHDAYFPHLEAPVEDAKAVDARLKALGFETEILSNPTKRRLTQAVDDFGARLARRGGVGLFYFSGHGAMKTDEETNYLIPAGTNIRTENDLPEEAVNAQRIANRMKEAKNSLNLVLLDACRSHGLPRGDGGKAGGGGLAAMRGARGLIFFFATQPGAIAIEDGAAKRSVFTTALLTHIEKPGLSFMDMISDVTAETEKISADPKDPKAFVQTPFVSGTVVGRFYFKPTLEPPPLPSTPTPRQPQPAIEGVNAGSTAGERMELEIAPGISMAFRWCPPGSFTMGSPLSEKNALKAAGKQESFYADEAPHKVTLTGGFWLAETAVTQGQWKAVMNTSLVDQANKMLADDTLYDLGGKKQALRSWSNAQVGDGTKQIGNQEDDIAMYFVNWHEANEFCDKAGGKLAARLPGSIMRLPTEAEWEYACRAGTKTMTYAGDFTIKGEKNAPGLDNIAWYGGNSSVGYEGVGWDTASWKEKQYPGGRAGPRKVGTKLPNPWGLNDTIGNVWQWCGDWYGNYASGSVTDPQGAGTGADRVIRGGSWGMGADSCRAALRGGGNPPGVRFNDLGFRPALVPSK